MDIPDRSSDDTKRLELLGLLISRCKEETLLGDLPDPIEATEAMTDMRGMTRRDNCGTCRRACYCGPTIW